MALFAFDGFDHYNDTSDFVARSSGNLMWSTGIAVGISGPGRFGYGKSVGVGSIESFTGSFITQKQTWFCGFAASANPGFAANIGDSVGGVTHLSITFSASTGRVTASRGSTTIAISNNNVWSGAAYSYIEILATIDSSIGQLVVRIEGVPVLSYSGNTRNGGTATWDNISLGGAFPGGASFDDFYYADTSIGPNPTFPCNTFLGDVRVQTLFAVGTGAGGVQWSPLSGTNYQMINETAMDGDTTYNYSDTPSQADYFNFQPLIASPVPISVQTTGAYRATSAGSRTINQFIVSNVTTENGSTYPLSGSYVYYTDQYPVDPNTGLAWTTAAVDALQAGYKLDT